MCLKYSQIPGKELSFHSNDDSSSVTTDTGGAFSICLNITPGKSLRCGIMMSHWPTFTLASAKLYLKLWGNGKLLNFLIFVGTSYCELKPFLEMVL